MSGPTDGYDVEPGTHVLVRPDGYIAAIGSADTVEHWLTRFAPDATPDAGDSVSTAWSHSRVRRRYC
jgi:hypothetical protein